MTSPDLTIINVDAWPVDIPLTDDFVISRGKVTVANNVFVRVDLACGTAGYGEIAPFADLAGEDQHGCLRTALELAEVLVGHSAMNYRRLSRLMSEFTEQPAPRAGLEAAVVDAFCLASGIPMWALWGGAAPFPHDTDITIPILKDERVLELADHWYHEGFRTFKLKVGMNVDQDVARIAKIAERCDGVRFIIDANQGYTEADAVRFIGDLGARAQQVVLFEQPVAREDLGGMAAVRSKSGVTVAADESVFTPADALAVVQAGAADVINLKVMKSGLMETLAIANIAKAAGLGLMIGGMVETRLAMSVSLSIAMGVGGIGYLDLDTPLLLVEDPLEGGYQYDGPTMSVWDEPGVGMEPRRGWLPELGP